MPKAAKDIFLAAVEIADASERGRYLDQSTGGDTDLRRRVEALLRAEKEPDSFLDHPAVAPGDAAASEETQDLDTPSGSHDERVSRGGAQTAPSPSSEVSLSFLAPPQRKGSLGRLDHYEVLEVLGKGGFGTVLKAFDEKLHRMVAIKLLAPELAASGPAKKRFLREARSAAAVKHENIVGIYDVQESSAVPYLAMEFIDGQSLQQKLDKSGPLEMKEILRIGYQIAGGLAAAHKQGVIHRDIKPANILLENGVERVKITDFGLAKIADDASVTQSGVVAGTPAYMSPEQAEGLTLDQRSDLFSLGTVLYVMCTGRPPFRASGTMAVLKRVCEEMPRPIREINSEIPPWLCDVIAKLHAKKPEERFQTAKEVADLLSSYLAEIQLHGGVASPAAAAVTIPVADAPGSPISSGLRGALPWLGGGVAIAIILLATAFATRWKSTDPPVRMEGGDILNRLVGTWSIDLERIAPEPGKQLGKVRFEWVAQGKFLRGYAVNASGQESMTIYGYDDRTKTFRRWFFASDPDPTSIQGPHEGKWDAKAAVLTSQGELPLFHQITHEDRWLDADNVEIHVAIKDHQGKIIARQTKKLRRTTTNEVVGPKLPPDARRPAEMALFDGSAGIWTTEADVTLAELGGQKVKSTTTAENSLILGGRFLESRDRMDAGTREDYVIVCFDENRRSYRFWDFASNGDTLEAEGAWHEKTRQLAWKSLDGKFEAAWTFTSPHERKSAGFFKDSQGRRVLEVEAVAKRAGDIKEQRNVGAPPFAVAPFDENKAKEHQDAWAKHLGVEPEITNAYGMKLRLIPPGKNTLGASGPAESAEAFFLGATEVTVDQFRRFVNEQKYETAGEANKLGGVRVGKKSIRDAGYVWSHPDFALSGDHPVTLVTWHDAMAFCDWLSRKEDRTYRLPTSAEWRWAERAGSAARFYFGDNLANIDAHAWHIGNSEMHSHPVGLKERNPWGLFDVYGNAWELSYDWQRAGKLADLMLRKAGPNANDRILFLGGGFSVAADGGVEAYGPGGIGYSHYGFRVALVGDLKPKTPLPAVAPP